MGDAGMAAALSHRVFESSEGNPLFVEELVRMLIDERHLEQDPSRSPCLPPSTRCWPLASTGSTR